MVKGFRPMRAATLELADLEQLTFPKLVSTKYDGVRAVVVDGVVYSRKLKRIPNLAIQAEFGPRPELNWREFELVSGPPSAPNCIRRTMSQVTSVHGGTKGLNVFVYDFAGPRHRHRPYYVRSHLLLSAHRVVVVKQTTVTTLRHLRLLEGKAVKRGYEGVIVRDPAAPYKCGDTTLREQYLMKFKPFKDAEAVVLEVYEEMENRNAQTRDERGYAKRSTHKANKVGKGRVGGFRARDLKTKVEFDCAPGKLTAKERVSLWSVRQALPGRIFTYRFQEAGVKEKPRFPRFRTWRDRRDVL